MHIDDESDPPQSEPEVRRSPFGANNRVWIEVNYDDLNFGSKLELFWALLRILERLLFKVPP